MMRGFLWWLVALIACNGGLMSRAQAQDSQGVYGTRYGCAVVTAATGSWGELTSDDLYDAATGSALAAGLFLSSLSLVSREAYGGTAAFLCLGPAASCPAATTNAPKIDAGAVRTMEVRGVLSGTAQTSITTVSLRGDGAGATVEVCAHFRKVP